MPNFKPLWNISSHNQIRYFLKNYCHNTHTYIKPIIWIYLWQHILRYFSHVLFDLVMSSLIKAYNRFIHRSIEMILDSAFVSVRLWIFSNSTNSILDALLFFNRSLCFVRLDALRICARIKLYQVFMLIM